MATSTGDFENSSYTQSGEINAQPIWDSAFYDELRRRAGGLLRGFHADNQLQAEDLVHDAYLRLTRSAVDQYVNDDGHYMAIAVRAMKRSLIDRARAGRAIKRFGHLRRTDLSDVTFGTVDPAIERIWINDLMQRCLLLNARQSTAAHMYFLEGRTTEEIGAALKLSARTVKRDLRVLTLHLRQQFEVPKRAVN